MAQNKISSCVLSFLKRVGTPFPSSSKTYAEEDIRKQVVKNVEVKEGCLVFETVKTNTPEPPKTNKRGRKRK